VSAGFDEGSLNRGGPSCSSRALLQIPWHRPATPGFLGQLSGADGKPIVIDGLWGLAPGNDGNGGSSQSIYFSAGPNGEADGLFGVLESGQPVPAPSSMVLELTAVGLLAGRRAWKNRRRTAPARR
jgi:hypothetical protein